MFLAASALAEARPKEGPLLFLGPWCRRPGEKGAVLPDPWEALEARRAAYRECLALHDALLDALPEPLNALHGLRLSPRAWRVLLSPWLIRYVQVMKDRHARLKLAFAADPGLESVSVPRDRRRLPADAYEFTILSYHDHYNLQLLSALSEAMGRPAPAADLTVPLVDSFASVHARADGAAARAARSAGRAVAGARRWPLLLHGLPGGAGLLRRLAPSAWVLRTRPLPPRPSVPRAEREGLLSGFKPDGEFAAALAKTLPADVPSAYVERLPDLLAEARRLMPRPPAVLASADGWTYDETFKACAALAADAGSRLVAVQHGGGYGQYGRIWQEAAERAVCDSYWTWGWAGQEDDARLRNAPSPWLDFPPDSGAPGEGMLLVGTYQPRWRYGFQSQAQAEQFESYLDARGAFARALPPEARAALSARLSPNDLGWNQAARLAAAAPEVRVEAAAGPLHARLRSAALSVFDHPATSFLEALALGRPCLLFWDPSLWDERPSAKPLLDGLRRARVLHDDPPSAAREAAAALADPRAWWDRAEARAAVSAFRSRYCLRSSSWRAEWAAGLRAELPA